MDDREELLARIDELERKMALGFRAMKVQLDQLDMHLAHVQAFVEDAVRRDE